MISRISKAKRGPVMPDPKGKTRITIRVDEDVINWFRTRVEKSKVGGGNYRSLINDALRLYVAQAREPSKKRCDGWFVRKSGGRVSEVPNGASSIPCRKPTCGE